MFICYIFYSSPEMVHAGQITYMLFGKLTDLFVRCIVSDVSFVLYIYIL